MAINYYRWDDPSAPILTGESGKLVALLDACLINGYGAKTSAGWTKPFSATDIGVYRHPDAGSAYFKIIDDGSVSASSTENAGLRGYMQMSDINTGTNAFPIISQYCGIKKSTVTTATSKEWVLLEDGGMVYLYIAHNLLTSYGGTYAFGKFNSRVVGDQYNYMIGASYSDHGAYAYAPWMTSNTATGVAARAYNGIDESKLINNYSMHNWTGLVSTSNVGVSELDGTFTLQEDVLLGELNDTSKVVIRGIYPGMHGIFEQLSANAYNASTFNSRDGLKSYIIFPLYTTSNPVANYAFEITDGGTWWS